MFGDALRSRLRVELEDVLYLGKWDFQLAECRHEASLFELTDLVVAVAGRTVDSRRHQQTDLAVEAQCLRGKTGASGELSDAQLFHYRLPRHRVIYLVRSVCGFPPRPMSRRSDASQRLFEEIGHPDGRAGTGRPTANQSTRRTTPDVWFRQLDLSSGRNRVIVSVSGVGVRGVPGGPAHWCTCTQVRRSGG
jgi:hypothetical protein